MLLSIITVVYNDKAGFFKTLNSIVEQKKYYNRIEYIVIDGGSTDGTKDLFVEYSHCIDYCVSEPDSGIYDAMNKGAKAANGEALLYMNAGDYFVGNVLGGLSNAPVFLKVKYVDIFGRFRDRPVVDEKIGISNCHQGIIFENKGILYDTEYKICADYKYFLDHGYDKKISILCSPGYVFFDAVGISARQIKQRDHEVYLIRKKHYGALKGIIYETMPLLKRSVRFFLKRTIGK